MHPDWIVPDGLPAGAGALMTTRAGGVSAPPWDTMNLGVAVGDDAEAVRLNRAAFAAAIGAEPAWLRQVHGATVLRLPAPATTGPHEADAAVTAERGVACVVQVADCLPVLLAAPDGRAVAAAHAGWRGLAAGVVDAALVALCEAGGCAPADVCVWLGPCIGPRRFEVGADVVDAFGGGARFAPSAPRDGVPKWYADLAGLARDRLARLGVRAPAGGGWCTVEAPARFYSFRRDGRTGRMAAAIWRR
jgi:YfiH family protein